MIRRKNRSHRPRFRSLYAVWKPNSRASTCASFSVAGSPSKSTNTCVSNSPTSPLQSTGATSVTSTIPINPDAMDPSTMRSDTVRLNAKRKSVSVWAPNCGFTAGQKQVLLVGEDPAPPVPSSLAACRNRRLTPCLSTVYVESIRRTPSSNRPVSPLPLHPRHIPVTKNRRRTNDVNTVSVGEGDGEEDPVSVPPSWPLLSPVIFSINVTFVMDRKDKSHTVSVRRLYVARNASSTTDHSVAVSPVTSPSKSTYTSDVNVSSSSGQSIKSISTASTIARTSITLPSFRRSMRRFWNSTRNSSSFGDRY